MDTQLCKEFIKIIPHAAALFIANGNDGYKLVECNQRFSSAFSLGEINASDAISSIRAKDNFLSRSIMHGINEIMKNEKSEFIQEQSDYNIILSKVNLEEKEYLLILLLSVAKEIQSTIKNYESFYNSIDDMFLVGDRDGTILFSNNAVTKKLGYSKEELKRMHILALHPKEKIKEAEEILADMFKHKRDVCPLPLMKKNGQHLPVETRIWFGEWDGEEQIFSISKDLSAEQGALQKFTKLFDCNPACIAITSLETGLYSRVNKALLKTFGFSEDEVIGKTAAELGIIVDIEIYHEAKEELLSKGFFKDIIIKVRRKTGEIIIGLFSGEIVESQGERLSMTTMVDLTHQTETEQKLAREGKLQEILIDLSSRYINCSLTNIEDDVQASLETVGRFVDADRVYIFEYDFQERITKNTFEWCNDSIEPQIEFLQAIPLDSVPDWENSHTQGKSIIIRDVSELDGNISSVKEILESQGVKSLVTIPMMFEHECLGFVGFDAVKEKYIYTDSEIDLLTFYAQILANIHLRRTHEQDIQTAREKAEKANKAKNNFIAKTSHELRNPLNGAWGFLNLLEGLIHEGKERQYLLNSIQSLSDTIKILNDLLDISKIETNELKLNDDKIDIFNLMTDAIVPYKPEIKSKGIQLDIKLDSDISRNLIGDTSRLKQIIGNLVLNAVTHAQPTEIEIGCTLKEQTSDTAELLFFVKDDGVGIHKELINQVFNLFYKYDSSSPGSGLGLPICKEFVNLMGGDIWAESTENKGSDFYFTIPFRIGLPDHIMRGNSNNEGPLDLKHLRILLAEDNAINQMLVIEMLKPMEISVTAVPNGAEALEALGNSQFDLILMDIQMPVMDGLEAIKRIRESQNSIPILALTGSVLPKEKERYINCGANEIVEKPIFIDVLLEKIRLALNSKIK